MTHLVVPGIDPTNQGASWRVLLARNAAYYADREDEADRQQFERMLAELSCQACLHDTHGLCSGHRRRGRCACWLLNHNEPPRKDSRNLAPAHH